MNHTRLITIVVILTSGAAWAQSSIGSYSKCKSQLRGKPAEISLCEQCLNGGGGFYNYDKGAKRWVCGATSDMRPSQLAGVYKPPPRPSAMPRTASDYKQVAAATFKIGMQPDEEGNQNDEFFDGATVTITRPFLIKATEVTHAEWYFVMGKIGDRFDRQFERDCGLDCPMSGMSWKDALRYLNALSVLEKREPCYEFKGDRAIWKKGLDCEGYRLPTEAEWELAARGGEAGARYGEPDDIAWHVFNSDDRVHVVGKKKANAYGLFDMLGNASEWTWDRYEPGKVFEGELRDPVGGGLEQAHPEDRRVVRGGSASTTPVGIRATLRESDLSHLPGGHGFRPVRTVKVAR